MATTAVEMKEMREQLKAKLWFEHGENVAQFEKGGLRLIEATRDEASDKALRFSIGDKHYWFPKSQISTLVDPDGKCYYYAPFWMVEQKGLL